MLYVREKPLTRKENVKGKRKKLKLRMFWMWAGRVTLRINITWTVSLAE